MQDMVDQWVCHDWLDFMFNLISMCIVYAYFSKAAGPHESITAVLLCMAVAAFDILLLLLRWLWCVFLSVLLLRKRVVNLCDVCVQCCASQLHKNAQQRLHQYHIPK